MNKGVFIIAEAGVNHNGNLDIAKKMIKSAYQAGADAVKFQTFKAGKIVCANAVKAEYQTKITDVDETQFEMLKKLELTYSDHLELLSCCKYYGIEFLSTPFDLDSIKLLEKIGMRIYKIPSGEITNLPYLRAIGKLNKKIIMSTGMANVEEVKYAYNTLIKVGTLHDNITILHANTEYPTPFEDVNLNAMLTIKKEFGVKVGYSDHTLGIDVPIAAVAMGATVIEKHFTLDQNMAGPDHKASLEPYELKAMIVAIRNIEKALGNGVKQPSKSEIPNINIARKSIVAKMRIDKGKVFTNENITTKRPGIGISPMAWDDIIGTVAGKNYKEDDLIEEKFV
jgi:N,N'-diacetyllegionaminate synthase